jgi:hypothetical protein
MTHQANIHRDTSLPQNDFDTNQHVTVTDDDGVYGNISNKVIMDNLLLENYFLKLQISASMVQTRSITAANNAMTQPVEKSAVATSAVAKPTVVEQSVTERNIGKVLDFLGW